MTTSSEIDKLLSEAADRLKREAYAAGWRDAMVAVNKAISDVANSPPEGLIEIEIGEIAPAGLTNAAGRGPTQGTTPWYIWQAVRRKPGMTGAEIVGVLHDQEGLKASDASIRTGIARLKRRKLITVRHGRWFPA